MEILELKIGDKVKIIPIPIVENNEYGQLRINTTIGKIGKVTSIAKNGNRNIWVTFANYDYNYYNIEDLEIQPIYETPELINK